MGWCSMRNFKGSSSDIPHSIYLLKSTNWEIEFRFCLLKSTEIRFNLSFSDWFVTKRNYVRFEINWRIINTIRFHLLQQEWAVVPAARTPHAQHYPDWWESEKYFRNLIKSTWNQIVFTIFRLIWSQTDIRLDPNQPENSKYNLISGWINKIPKSFLSV